MRATLWVLALLTVATLAGGCRQRTEFDGRRYRHNGMCFAVDVPQGWAHQEMQGDVLLELAGPAPAGSRVRPMVHVFSRRETQPVDLDRAAEELRRLLDEERRFDPMTPKTESASGDLAVSPAEVATSPPGQSGRDAPETELPARLVTRTVREAATIIHQRLLVVAKGRQVWALLVAVPQGADQVEGDIREITGSFRVW